MAKNICVVCSNSVGMLARKAQIQDGIVCGKCLDGAGLSHLPNSKSHDAASVKELINHRTSFASSFNATKIIDNHLKIDEKGKLFMVDSNLFEFSNLLDFELLEDGETITKGGLGSAVAGGLLFGGAGAVVGAVVGGKKTKSVCNDMKIKITVKNSFMDTVYISFIGLFEKGIKTDSIIYKDAQSKAQRCLSALQIIADANSSTDTHSSPAAGPVDVAAEIQKFHELKEKGIITEADFNTKKSQLLGI